MDYMDFIRPLSVVAFFITVRNIADFKISYLKLSGWTILAYLLTTVSVYLSEILGSVVLLVTIFIMLYINDIRILPSIFSTLFTMIILVICNTASGIILSKVYSGVDYYAVVSDDFWIYISLLFLNLIFSYIISKLTSLVLYKKMKIKTAAIRSVNKVATLTFLAALILVFTFIYFTAATRMIWDNPALLITYITFLVTLLIYVYFIFTTTIKEIKLKRSRQELKQLEEYTGNIETMYKNIHSMRHDYSNVILSIAGYLADNDIVGLKKYFKNKIEPFADKMETDDSNIENLAMLKESSLKGVYAVKLIKAQENGIEVIVDIKDRIDIKAIDIIDLNRVVGILLDNAHEAAIECSKPYIHTGIVKKDNQISIIVVNCIKNKNINIKNIFERGFSTKGDNRGYGLNNVITILEKYKNVYLDTVIEKNEFKQIILIEEKE